jgi:hypothetical protein
MFDALSNDHTNKVKHAYNQVTDKAIPCTCGKKPYLRETPTLQGRSKHYLLCVCGESGVIIYDGVSLSKEYVDKAIEGWNNRIELKAKGITETSMKEEAL